MLWPFLLCLLWATAPTAWAQFGMTKTTGADYGAPPTVTSVSGKLDAVLDFDYHTYSGPSDTVKTRAMNGSIPGPTFVFSAGDTVRILFRNKMTGPNPAGVMNEYRTPETTNLHTHGLHVSSLSPQDNVKLEILPGEEYQYEYQIPKDHLPGTHWYHPHHHGSTALHVGGGAFGVLIVQDPAGTLPAEVEAMGMGQVLCFSHMGTRALTEIASTSGDTWFSVTGATQDIVLLNGLTKPKLTMQPGEWQRWRMVFAGVDEALNIVLNSCELQLLAKDGVYLTSLPRTVTTIQLPPGGRADVAVRCPTAGTYTLSSTNRDITHDLATISVTGTAVASSPLATFKYPMPAYLTDLLNTAANATFALNINGGGGCSVNNVAFTSMTNYLSCMELGTVQEWSFQGQNAHPIHIHVNPYQITSIAADEYHQVGDWHDTLLTSAGGQVTVRFRTADFPGPVVIHCHILAHEDRGCMGLAYIYNGSNANDTCVVSAALPLLAPRSVPFWAALVAVVVTIASGSR
uniref:Plastocyanin-like domain-containing protein n=1 Tax=Eutreptiella gymnastica TaxID=73025 RepID=A0A6U7UT21_9EUGL|mmetsp:Transcript_126276/g.218788  ORF Transcript_126276/g.218788 Transcript_126276/m.218788 type:complete len:516 (+) Transcript_126276:36-1583(+)